MYHFFKDEPFLRKAKNKTNEIMKNLESHVREAGIPCQFSLMGSAKRNMVTQNGNGEIDFDYNLFLYDAPARLDAKETKETIRRCFNKVMKDIGLCDVQDSRSVLTSHSLQLKTDSRYSLHIDVAIVAKDESGHWNRLIHEKTGDSRRDRFYWNQARDSSDSKEKEKWLKKHGRWEEVRETYLEIKNRYLKRGDHDHPSFICFLEAINQVYQRVAGSNS